MAYTKIIETIISTVGLLTTVIAIALFFWAIISWLLGVYPLFLRLGFGRWKRKITIVAGRDMYGLLEKDLVATGIFRKNNIDNVDAGTLTKIKDSTLALIHYQSFSAEEINTILRNKQPNAGFIFYFPEFSLPDKIIPAEIMKAINNEQFATVVNMRGRLVNDIVVTMLSTSYEKRKY